MLDAFAGQRVDLRRLLGADFQRIDIRRAMPVMRIKTEKAQDAQIIFRYALRGIADETHAPRFCVFLAAEIIEYLALTRRLGVLFRSCKPNSL